MWPRGSIFPYRIYTMAASGIPVLNYHAIDDTDNINSSHNVSVSLASFKEQISWLHKEGYKTVTNEELNDLLFHKKKIPGKHVLITFDDGYFSLHKYALGILSDFGYTATLFLSTSFIGNPYNQNDFEFVNHDRQLTWPEIRDLSSNGWSIQSHGYTHTRMTHLDIPSIAKEVTLSKTIIEQNLGKTVDAFAFPYGIYNKAVIDQLKNAGYTSAYTVHSGKLYPSAKRFQIPRIEINNADSMDSYKIKVLTGYTSATNGIRSKIRDIAFANPSVKDLIEKWAHRMGYGNR